MNHKTKRAWVAGFFAAVGIAAVAKANPAPTCQMIEDAQGRTAGFVDGLGAFPQSGEVSYPVDWVEHGGGGLPIIAAVPLEESYIGVVQGGGIADAVVFEAPHCTGSPYLALSAFVTPPSSSEVPKPNWIQAAIVGSSLYLRVPDSVVRTISAQSIRSSTGVCDEFPFFVAALPTQSPTSLTGYQPPFRYVPCDESSAARPSAPHRNDENSLRLRTGGVR